MIELNTDNVTDGKTKEALIDLVETLNLQPFLAGNWSFLTLKIKKVEVSNRPTYLITENLESLILTEAGERILV